MFIDDTTTLQRLNWCRMQKHVPWLSDVFSADGTTITSQSYSTCTHFSPYEWPIKHHTTTTDWAQWHQCISTLADRFMLLPERDYYQRSEALLSTNKETLFLKQRETHWSMRTKHLSHRNTRILKYCMVGFQVTTPLPSNCTQVKVTQHSNPHQIIVQIPFSSNSRYTNQTKEEEIIPWTHQYVNTSQKLSTLLQDYSKGKAQCGSDGSYAPSWMKISFAWRIELEDSREFIE